MEQYHQIETSSHLSVENIASAVPELERELEAFYGTSSSKVKYTTNKSNY